MKIELNRSDRIAGSAHRLTLERYDGPRALRVRIECEDKSGATITVSKQDLVDALKAL